MSHIIDANGWIDHLRRGAASKVSIRIKAAPPGSVYLCSVVVGELLFGAERSPPQYRTANLASAATLRQEFVSLAYDDAAAEHYAQIRAHLAAAGTPIGANDMMIAAIALALDMTLVTHNTREFSRVPNLRLEDWQ